MRPNSDCNLNKSLQEIDRSTCEIVLSTNSSFLQIRPIDRQQLFPSTFKSCLHQRKQGRRGAIISYFPQRFIPFLLNFLQRTI
ncbi:unnamed protein product [Allacma fusca]|uniref:Uncharacterized protein n=1 Tax=Allacma fusca TaxID=39272 RepID=A0A8J2JUQ8_9HEXA|nr:unnamed protein product [Allacma fusca]